ncbi:type IV pilus modification protein PilV [Endozoicomonas sp. G2_1]|uniref:type IV pilus modification protein PilV n=1 Tax=Endozoicomonas sp. G2_1 TaxID=2821091 RepID=UPI001ADD5B84|nr:type IV pilus modification protein PilV [Endozoicomonas sp. G2_1]MBO9490149.1 type IV pilus modification protein PilV [Endozoicomonas sp. G2_1]
MKNSAGFSFIEVLVALVILASGILGAVAMQTTAKKGSFDAMQRSMASALAQDIIERMRNNDIDQLANYAGTYGAGNFAQGNNCDTPANLCSPVNIRIRDQYEWEQKLIGSDTKSGNVNAGGLSSASGCINHNNNAVTVVVSWEGRTEVADGADAGIGAVSSNCGTASGTRRQVIIQAFIF